LRIFADGVKTRFLVASYQQSKSDSHLNLWIPLISRSGLSHSREKAAEVAIICNRRFVSGAHASLGEAACVRLAIRLASNAPELAAVTQ
jgi:hypothetical protein